MVPNNMYNRPNNNFVQPAHCLFCNHVSDFWTCERFRVYIPIMDPLRPSHRLNLHLDLDSIYF